MSGVEGLGRSVLPDTGAPLWAGDLASSLDQVGLQVTAENVMGVAEALLGEARRLRAELRKHSRAVGVQNCGHDPVSSDAAREFSPRLRALAAQGMAVADILASAGQRLATGAREYGRTDVEIAELMRRYEADLP